jgi:type IV fimbrial biogenesis protein FimT
MKVTGIAPAFTRLVSRSRGFTLTEFLVVVTIGGILLAIAVPSLSGMLAAQRVKTGSFDLYASLIFARSEAIKRNTVIDVAPYGSNLANGWQVRSGATVLRDQGGLSGVSVAGPAGSVSFDPDGRLTATGRVDFRLSSALDTHIVPRCVVVDLSGRPSLRLDRNRDGNCLNG